MVGGRLPSIQEAVRFGLQKGFKLFGGSKGTWLDIERSVGSAMQANYLTFDPNAFHNPDFMTPQAFLCVKDKDGEQESPTSLIIGR